MQRNRIQRLTIATLMMLTAMSAWPQKHFVFTPQWKAQAQFAGYYVAQEKGFYKDEGLSVQTSMNNALVIVSRRGKSPMQQKGARVGIWRADFGEMAVCMSRKEGLGYEWIH